MTGSSIRGTVRPVDWTKLRSRARTWSLLFCVALGVYLLSMMLSARLGLWFTLTLSETAPIWAQVALAVVALDLAKVPALALGIWLLARTSLLSPLGAAAGLVLMTYMLELIVSLALVQADTLFLKLVVLACRLPVVVLLIYLGLLLGRWLRRRVAG